MRPIENKIKVLHLIASPVLGGAETVLLTLARNSTKHKVEVKLGIFIDKRVGKNPLWEAARHYNLSCEPISFKNPYDFRQLIDLFKIVSGFRPHIIHSHGYKSNWLGFIIAKFFGIKVMSTLHGWVGGNSMKTNIIEKIDRRLFMHFDKIITVSDQLRAFLNSHGISNCKMVSIRNVPPALNATKCANKFSTRSNFGIPLNCKLVGFVGRLESVKGCKILIEAANHAKEQVNDIHYIIVGDGSERSDLEIQVRLLGLENYFHFCGFQSDVAEIYISLDLYVLSSINEGIPITLLEAMANEVPVVATAVGGVPEVIQDGVTGILVRPNDPKALAEAIVYSLINTQETRKRIQRATDHIRAEYNIENWMERIEDTYAKLLT